MEKIKCEGNGCVRIKKTDGRETEKGKKKVTEWTMTERS